MQTRAIQRLIAAASALAAIIALALLGAWNRPIVKSLAQDVSILIGKNQSPQADHLEAVSFVVPHHLLADQIIEHVFQEVAVRNQKKRVDRIVLLSPNHFNAGRYWITAHEGDWKMKSGAIETDQPALQKLEKTAGVGVDDSAFDREHGIRNLLPFVTKYFSGVKIVALAVKDGLPDEKASALVAGIADLSGNTLFILSADFSHYLDRNAAEFHNQKAVDVLANLDLEAVNNLDIDTAPGARVLMEYSQRKGHESFNLVESSNSAEITGQDIPGENTSYVSGYYTRESEKSSERIVQLLFLGDVMLDRDVAALMERRGIKWPTEKIERLFWGQDLNIANLEGPITSSQSISRGTKENEKNHFKFTFDANRALQFLRQNRINNVSIGNNHILNFGSNGLAETRAVLDSGNIGFFGDPEDQSRSYITKEAGGQKIALVGYNQFAGPSAEEILNIIKEADQASDYIIVYAHWGREYDFKENEQQRNLARHFIDSGADLVIGSHPHVIQPIEIYKNKAIFYSLGNFIFDQYFDEDVRTMLGLGVSLSGTKEEFFLFPLYLERGGQLVLSASEIKSRTLDRIAEQSSVDNFLRSAIKKGRLTVEN